MKVLVTGANGFLGKNLQLHLAERSDVEVVRYTRENDASQLPELLQGVDLVFHLAGVNRSDHASDFQAGNKELAERLCDAVGTAGRSIPVVFASSIQAERDNVYGSTKRQAESAFFDLQRKSGVPVHVFRLANVFGKWCRPNYNSVVATFCHNVARGLPIQINDPAAVVTLVYVDDVVGRFLQIMDGADRSLDSGGFEKISPQYTIRLGELAELIGKFKESRSTLVTERVGTGLVRALYSTYVSYLPIEEFTYLLPQYGDQRGVFVEMLKTPECGQFSYFTARAGVTRGGHYHHSKTEKFLVLKGQARFKFRHMHTGQIHEVFVCGDRAEVVETVPGWTHDITNVGTDELVVMLWANEIFDRSKADTYACAV